MENITVKNLPESERPYEKFLKSGTGSLSDADLLAIILKSGTRGCTSMELARHILADHDSNLLNLYTMSYEELLEYEGIGPVKAIQLKAVAELAVRIASARHQTHLNLKEPSSVADYYMERMCHLGEEHVFCAFFDVKYNFLGDTDISKGCLNRALISPRDIFCRAIEKHASSIILLHNHPSGDPSPSQEDCRITEQLRQGCQILDLVFSDHIIIGDHCYFSFSENRKGTL